MSCVSVVLNEQNLLYGEDTNLGTSPTTTKLL